MPRSPDALSLVAYNLRRIRRAANVPQHALAAQAGCTRQMVQMIETGRTGVSLGLVDAFARVLGVKVSDLFRAVPKG